MVIKLRHLGDVLLTTPVFRCVRRAHPTAHILACVNEGTETILETNPDLNEIVRIPRRVRAPLRRWLAEGKAIQQVRRFRPDLVIDLTGTDRSAILSRLSGAKQRWGLARSAGFAGKNRLYTKAVRKRLGLHVVEFQGKFLEDCGLSGYEGKLIFPVPSSARKQIAETLGSLDRYTHIHPVSRLMMKTWPAAFMARLIDHLATRSLRTVLTASADPVETAWISELKSLTKSQPLDLSGKLSLAQLAALSEEAVLFAGVDSAPMHIAAAVGTPVIGIFGPSSETLWGPWCAKKLVLSRNDLDCRLPCKLKNTCPHIACLREMTPEMVLPRVDQFLDSLHL